MLDTPSTPFTRDIVGRWVCNTFYEAQLSADPSDRPNEPRGPSPGAPMGARPDARPFDFIIIGGGSFGAVVAQHLFNKTAAPHRVLVLEAGPMAIPEHVQNMALLGLDPPGPTRIADLRAIGQDRLPRVEVWGLPWHSPVPFPGLAYCVGGRSLFFGGWSPQLLAGEMPLTPDVRHPNSWPAVTVDELTARYFAEAAEQIGTDSANDFIHGPMHDALLQQLFKGINAGQVPEAIPLASLPLTVAVPEGTSATTKNKLKLEAPLAVQSRARSGFFPVNKFSSVPMLLRTARLAQQQSGGDDVKKRLMVVPNCHVKRLITSKGRVTAVQTSAGDVVVPDAGVVIIATATIESARLAQLSFGGIPNDTLPGTNLMTHLRSNLTIRIPRTSVSTLAATVTELQASALFVKGRHPLSGTPAAGHFHLQITAAGLAPLNTDTNSEAELFKKIPDLDGFDQFRGVTDDHIILTIRGIGETHPMNTDTFVRLDPEPDEYTVQRAFVGLADPNDAAQRASNAVTARDFDLWNAMDRATDDVAKVFADNLPFKVLDADKNWHDVLPTTDLSTVLPYTFASIGGRRDGLGTTHHEAGTLWMGDDPTQSVTNGNGHFHHVGNAYALGPSLFPSVGSPNPMLTGVALARRLADHLTHPTLPFAPDAGFTALFDGLSTATWHMAGGGSFIQVDDVLETVADADLGLYWCDTPMPPDFVFRLEWLRTRNDDNSGVFIRFPHPDSKGYVNTHYVAVDFGFEVQIDEQGQAAAGQPVGLAIHKTGAIYDQPGQVLTQQPAHALGQWNQYEIRVQGQHYTVLLNGAVVSVFDFVAGSDLAHPDRALPSTSAQPRLIGLQAHTGRVLFRKVQFMAL
jgi:choline dehydrogenase-like flavoprotein